MYPHAANILECRMQIAGTGPVGFGPAGWGGSRLASHARSQ